MRGLTELGRSTSRRPAAGYPPSAAAASALTPQQVTEAWQPLAVELRKDTLL